VGVDHTDSARLVRWYGQVDGELRPGGRLRIYVADSDIESTGRVDVCEPPRRLLLTTRETDQSYPAAHLEGREYGDTGACWEDLVPRYQELAASLNDERR
jgi:uncharacterized protein YndB with AHSA1/START domain